MSLQALIDAVEAPSKEQINTWADELMADLALHGLLDINEYGDEITARCEIRDKLRLCAAHCRDDILRAIRASGGDA